MDQTAISASCAVRKTVLLKPPRGTSSAGCGLEEAQQGHLPVGVDPGGIPQWQGACRLCLRRALGFKLASGQHVALQHVLALSIAHI